MATKVSNTPWSNFSESDYNLQQWIKACLIHPDKPSKAKEDYKLPVREPDGTLNKNGIFAAASALAGGRGGVSASDAQKKQAAVKLMGLYVTIGEDAPTSIEKLAHIDVDYFLAHFGRLGMKWGVRRTPAELASNTPPEHSADAKAHQESLRKIATGGTHTLSDKEFKALNNRLQMQQQYSELLAKQKPKNTILRGHDAAKTVLAIAATGVTAYNLANSPAAKAGLRLLRTAASTSGKHVAKKSAAPAVSNALALVR